VGAGGEAGQRKLFPYADPLGGAVCYESKCREKERKGYRPQRTLEAERAPGRAARSGDLAAVAQHEIARGTQARAGLQGGSRRIESQAGELVVSAG
jgi:hypothetical protein